jgi:hypothetical protein
MGQAKRVEREENAPGAEATSAPAASAPTVDPTIAWQPPQPTRVGVIALAVVVAVVNLPILHYFLFRGVNEAPLPVPYANDFSQQSNLNDFFSTGGQWRVEDGQVLSPGVKNNPLWLKAKLPDNVSIEFDVRSMSPEGDIKCEIFGDGSDHSSGYVLIHGGWGNSLSIISRLDEHGMALTALQAEANKRSIENGKPNDLVGSGVFKIDTRMRVEANPYPVQVGKMYHWKIERRGGLITWFIDGNEFMRFDDPMPLVGEKHNRFGFSSWESQLYFDNLKVTPL